MRATLPVPCATSCRPLRRQCVAARPSPTPVPEPSPSQAVAGPILFPPTRIASAAVPAAVCAKGRRTARSALVPYRIALPSTRSALARRSFPANSPFAALRSFLQWLFSSCHHYEGFRPSVEEGFIGRLRSRGEAIPQNHLDDVEVAVRNAALVRILGP